MFKIPKEYRDKAIVLIDKYKSNEVTFNELTTKILEILNALLDIAVLAEFLEKEKKKDVFNSITNFVVDYQYVLDKNTAEEAVSAIEKRIILFVLDKCVFGENPLLSNILKPKNYKSDNT